MENVEGRRCDQCKENKYDRQRGCVDCPACYNLVQDAVATHRENLRKLEDVLKNINNNPTVVVDDDFEQKLKEVQSQIDELEQNAKFATGGMCQTCLLLFFLLMNGEFLITALIIVLCLIYTCVL